jgi:hypothetical protein
MSESMVDEVRSGLQLKRRPASIRAIAEEADVGYEWLMKFTHGHFDEPGAKKLERVRDALIRLRRRSRAA